MNWKPAIDNVIIELKKQEQMTASGILLPGNDKEIPMQGKIIAVGDDGIIDGKDVKMQYKVGQEVIYNKYSGTEFEIDDVKYAVIKQSDIRAFR